MSIKPISQIQLQTVILDYMHTCPVNLLVLCCVPDNIGGPNVLVETSYLKGFQIHNTKVNKKLDSP